MKSTCVLEWAEASGPATPSIMPVPNLCGVFEILRSSAYAMKVVMVGPVPGIAPNTVPTRVPRIIAGKARFSSALLGRMSAKVSLALLPTAFMRFTLSRKSATPNRPIEIAVSSSPSLSSGRPKAKRKLPLLTSVPTTPHSRPKSVIATPLSGEPRDMVEPASKPSNMIEKISVGPNLKAICTNNGDAKIMTMIPTDAAKNEAIIVMPSATPPLPCLVIGYPSRQVTACGGCEGMLSKMAPMAPPYCEP